MTAEINYDAPARFCPACGGDGFLKRFEPNALRNVMTAEG